MAFSATIRGIRYGGYGSNQLYGDWSGASGDAAGLFTVSGAVQAVIFQKFDPIDKTYQILPRVETSYSTGTNLTVITIENQDDVTTGKFLIDRTSM